MITDEEAKAAQELAKAGQAAIPAVQEFGRFVGRVIGGPLEQASGIIEDKLRYMRLERQVRLMRRSEELMHEAGLDEPTRALPLKVAVPLLQAATLEEDDELQDLWARLLVNGLNAESGIDVHRSLVSILSDFGPTEARLLSSIVEAPPEVTDQGVPTAGLPDSYIDIPEGKPPPAPPQHIQLSLWNLVRLGCISPVMTWGGPTITMVQPTPLGEALVRACTTRPRPRPSEVEA